MSMGFIKNGKYVQVAGNPPPSGELEAKVNNFGKKVLWAGSVTKGANIGTLNLAGYDMVIAYVGGRPAFLQGEPSNGARCKFVAHWTGRDVVDGPIYWQEYVCDVAADGTVLLCAWLRLAEGGAVASTVEETNVNLSHIIGYKFPTLA